MPTTSLIIGQDARFPLFAKGSDGTPRPAAFSVKSSDYSIGYVAVTGGNTVYAVSKAVGSFTATVTGHSQDGTALPPLVMSFDVIPVPVPQADHFEVGSLVVEDWAITRPDDPGTDTVTGTL